MIATSSRSNQSIQETRSGSTSDEHSTVSKGKLDLLFQTEFQEDEFNKSNSPICAYKLTCLYQHLGHAVAAAHWFDVAAKSPTCFPTLTNFLGPQHPDYPAFALHAGNNGHPGGFYAYAMSLVQNPDLHAAYLQKAALGGYPEACYRYAKLIGPNHEHFKLCIQGLTIATNPINSNYDLSATIWLQELKPIATPQPKPTLLVSGSSFSEESHGGNTSSPDESTSDESQLIPEVVTKKTDDVKPITQQQGHRGGHRRGCTLF